MRRIFYIPVLILLFYGCSQTPKIRKSENVVLKLLTTDQKYIAGSLIQLQFEYEQASNVSLLLKSAYGSTLIKPIVKGAILEFDIPQNFAKNAGVCNWALTTLVIRDLLSMVLPFLNPLVNKWKRPC